MYATEFPRDTFNGPYYLRTDKDGRWSRLVVNPRPACTAVCRWCAKTYPQRRQSGEQLISDVITPENLLDIVGSDELFLARSGGMDKLQQLNMITGDMPKSISSVDYLISLVREAYGRGFEGEWYYAGHQIETEEDLTKLKKALGEGTFVYTVEHFDKRKELMPIKGRMSMEEVRQILKTASEIFGIDMTQYYYIMGLDSINSAKKGVRILSDIAIPQVHVYTPYAPNHDSLYCRSDRRERMIDLLEMQKYILELFQKPIPSGSNRSLFSLD